MKPPAMPMPSPMVNRKYPVMMWSPWFSESRRRSGSFEPSSCSSRCPLHRYLDRLAAVAGRGKCAECFPAAIHFDDGRDAVRISFASARRQVGDYMSALGVPENKQHDGCHDQSHQHGVANVAVFSFHWFKSFRRVLSRNDSIDSSRSAACRRSWLDRWSESSNRV